MKLNLVRNLALLLAIIILSLGVGFNLGKAEVKKSVFNSPVAQQTISENVDFALFWNVWDKLKKTYFDRTKLDVKTMYYGAVSGMVAALGDPYTAFLTPDQNKENKQELSGTFEGIGAQLGYKDKNIVVIAPLPDSPAEKAGILAGDLILKIDDRFTVGMTLPEAVAKIRGKRGTKVKLAIRHEKSDSSTEIEIARDNIIVKSVTLTYKNQVAVIKLSQFGDNSNDEWNKAVTEIVNKGSAVKGVVLDLRNNPGGYLTGSVYIASEFLASGVVVIQEDGNGQKQNYSVDRQGRLVNKPLVVLVNQGSASASEIVAGALQDYKRARLVGLPSFGKGTIQDAQDLEEGAGLHVTVAKWLTPKGRWINGTGLTVDEKVEMDIKDPTKDPQLEKAIAMLAGK